MRTKIFALIILIAAVGLGVFVYRSENTSSRFPFRYGLDLSGGSHLVYEADVSGVQPGEVKDAMESLKSVIEKRVNLFGITESVVQVENAGTFGLGQGNRLIVELPGVNDLNKAIDLIGKTPLLEFKLLSDAGMEKVRSGVAVEELPADDFVDSGLTGRYLQKATIGFDQVTQSPYVTIKFNEEGQALFSEITKNNVGRILSIYLDGDMLSAPVIREEIPSGEAQITGSFTPEEARGLVRDLNLGALPVPIKLVSTENVGATLGIAALSSSVKAGLLGIGLVMLFMILYYRLPGFVASVTLTIYILITLAIFKLLPVTLTAAGIAGLILSIGMAVDANMLIFERMKEELKKGESYEEAARRGFERAWLSIRDGNLSTILSAIVLFWFGTSSVEGFALVLIIGVLVSMFTAITLTRTLLFAIMPKERGGFKDFLFKAR